MLLILKNKTKIKGVSVMRKMVSVIAIFTLFLFSANFSHAREPKRWWKNHTEHGIIFSVEAEITDLPLSADYKYVFKAKARKNDREYKVSWINMEVSNFGSLGMSKYEKKDNVSDLTRTSRVKGEHGTYVIALFKLEGVKDPIRVDINVADEKRGEQL